jgi:hypothetical protein
MLKEYIMEFTNIQNIKWANAENTAIYCEVNFTSVEQEEYSPFGAPLGTTDKVGELIIAACLSGKYGEIQEFVPEPIPPHVVVIPQVISMRQARLTLLQANLLSTVETAIGNSTDEAMKIEWEYATEFRRDWISLIALSEALGMTSQQMDELFLLGSSL